MEAKGELGMKEPISAREYKSLTSKRKKELRRQVEESGDDFEEFLVWSERLFPKGGKKNPITWRNK